MPSVYPWINPERKGLENVGLISLGSIDEKIPLILYPLLLSVDITLGCYRKHSFPPIPSRAFFDGIKRLIQNVEGKAIVFDLRVQDWPDFHRLRQSREFAHSLQHICSLQHISSSVILSSSSQQPGNLLGIPFEILEASEVLNGKGPADLVKFALEIGADFLLLTKRVRHKMDAHILLKEKILSGKASSLAQGILGTSSPYLFAQTKKRIYSPEKGYLHHWNPNTLLTLKNKFSTSFPGSGFALLKRYGDKLKIGDPIAETFLSEDPKKYDADNDFKRACVISSKPPDFRPFILERLEMKFS